MTTTYKLFNWADEEYTLRQVVDRYSKRLPQILFISSGYLGREEFSSDEIYWVYAIHKQPRVLLRDARGRFVSIPKDHPDGFCVQQPGKRMGRAISLALAIQECADPRVRIIPSNNGQMDVFYGADLNVTEKFDQLKYQDTYDQKYLLAYPLIDDQIVERTIVVPVFVPLIVDVAVGLKNFPSSMGRFCQDVTALTQDFKTTYEVDNGVIVFEEAPDEHYDYIEPFNKPGNLKINPTSAIPYNNTMFKRERKQEWTNTGVPCKYPFHKIPYPQIVKVEPVQVEPEPDIPAPPLPPRNVKPTRPPPAPTLDSPADTERYEESDYEIKHRFPQKKTTLAEDLKKALNKRFSVNDNKEQTSGNPSQHNATVRVPRHMPNSSQLQRSMSTGSLLFRTLADVPLDVTKLSVSQVSQCLNLLCMNQHVIKMREEQVDGKLLKALSKDMLVNSLGFSDFEATKLYQFVNGWRPKSEK